MNVLMLAVVALLALLLVAVVVGFGVCWWELRGLRMGEYAVWPNFRPRRRGKRRL